MVQNGDVMADEEAIEDAQRGRAFDPESAEYQESLRDEQRRMWSIGTAVNLALSLARIAPNAPTLNVPLTAEEICEFIETGRARTAPATRREQ